MKFTHNILIVDDKVENLIALERLLSDLDVNCIRAMSGNEALKLILEHDFSIALMDVQMPGMNGFETVELMRQEKKTRHLPVIFISAIYTDSYHQIKGIETGAVDFIAKPIVAEILVGKVRIFLEMHENKMMMQDEIKRRKESENNLKKSQAELEKLNLQLTKNLAKLRISEGRFKSLVMTIPDIVYRIDPDGNFTFVNVAVSRLGYEAANLIGRHFSEIIFPEDVASVSRELVLPEFAGKRTDQEKAPRLFDERRSSVRKTAGLEVRLLAGTLKSNGNRDDDEKNTVIVEVNSAGIYSVSRGTDDKVFLGSVGVIRDISERKIIENELEKHRDHLENMVEKRTTELKATQAHLIQTEKIAAIGTLAGGIAHDFNNILAAILGFSEACLQDAEKGTDLAEDLKEIFDAGNRAKDLVHQILAFSRDVEHVFAPVCIKHIVKEVLGLMRASLPATIEIKQSLRSDDFVTGDTSRIHQVLMNLCTNAGHAMAENGGLLEVVLEKVVIQQKDIFAHPVLHPGTYVKCDVKDSGHGIEPKLIKRIFDPFFTTKKVGQGTGLGLSVVAGIVGSHNGAVKVESEPGQGTVFSFFLPFCDISAENALECEADTPTGTERILFVDDEISIVKMGGKLLTSLGYQVTAFSGSMEALAAYKAKPEHFDLVITDMTMPKMTGEQLAASMRKIRPDIKVIVCTGYNAGLDERAAQEKGIQAIIDKPFSKQSFAETVRRVLDQPGVHP